MSKYAIQLYSMRDIASRDFLAAIDAAGEMGWDGVEFAGFFDLPAEKVKERLERWSLTPISSHVKFPLLEENLDEVLEYHRTLGVSYIICPNAGDWTDPPKTVEKLLRIKEKVEKAGFSFLYHNHNHEFAPVNGVRPVDLVIQGMQMELDIFWAWIAGENVASYLTARADTVRFLHVKDGNRKENTLRGGLSCALGEGSLPLAEILHTARQLGKDDWFIYENDVSENSVEQAKISLSTLRRCLD